MHKWVYLFGQNITEGKGEDTNLLGNKGANLAQMSLLDIPVPPGFTISTEVCNYYYQNNKQLPNLLVTQVENALDQIENMLDKQLGSAKDPLLLSIRSGSSVSMPGMMDTILNLGLNDYTVEALADKTNNRRFALDCYRRFIAMYSEIVLGVDSYLFEAELDLIKENFSLAKDSDLQPQHLEKLIQTYKEIILNSTGEEFPQDTKKQLWAAVKAVFNSWMNQRAVRYRKINNFSDEMGTAVNIQSMVFGNIDNQSATGVAFTRNPSNGVKQIFGEYLINAQGEDVVAGIRTPQVISKDVPKNIGVEMEPLEIFMPEAYQVLSSYFSKLENYYRDMQDIEFTIEQGKVWILQTRSGKRSVQAALYIAVAMYNEKLITKEEAICNINPESLEQILHPTIAADTKYDVLANGLPASPGAATGKIFFDADTVEKMSKLSDVILVRQETSPEDIHGMHAAKGILTTRGGMTSHAAVVARGMGKCCVCGTNNLIVDYVKKQIICGNKIIKEGEIITINGSTGEVIIGEVKVSLPVLPEEFHTIMEWSDEIKKLQVRANAETIADTEVANRFKADGIGLCRTEHMFFNNDRINVVREMILADNLEHRQQALDQLKKMQINDFTEIMKLMPNKSINIRLLDPPLHEFLPSDDREIIELANLLKLDEAYIKARINQLHEHNPMLGHRGCRIAISYPEIYKMQAAAIFLAFKEVQDNLGIDIKIEIMIPLIFSMQEFYIIKNLILAIKEEILGATACANISIGTMIELPRACIVADQIATESDFFSFGTNDLTQTTLGISRDDSASFIEKYIDHKILKNDPFVELDQQGVGELIKIAIAKGRSIKPDLKIGICGEHGANPASIQFFNDNNFDYISCSSYRLPIAKLAAAQAVIFASKYKK
jgi:pyruvate, orthophosphate dikinase